ncbi:MAG TPA: apolipoprotein N-acyltransferase [Bryobacteraceae bacterium]
MLLNLPLALATSLLLILAFPSFDIALLAPFALAPLLVASAREPGAKRRFLLGWAAGILYWAGVCYWVEYVLAKHGGMAPWAAWLAFALFSLAKALHLGVFALAAGPLLARRWALVTVPALWVAMERTHGDLGFAWLALGNAGVDMSMAARLAPYTGVYGISFVFAMMAAAIALLALRRPRIELAPLAVLLLLALLPKLPEARRGDETAVLVQPNASETAAWTPEWVAGMRERMQSLSLRAALAPGAPPPALIVWPEAPLPQYYDGDPAFRDAVNGLARRTGAYLIVNATPYTAAGAPLNSALLISPEGTMLGRYDKMNLVPFGEFVPWPFKALVDKMSTEAGDFAPGRRQVTLPAGAHRIGAFICYESVFPNFVRRFARDGADLYVNISNDGWYGRSAAREQHLKIVRMRAVESRRWILRATNDGVTSTIDPAGRVWRNLPPYTDGAARTGYSYVNRTTFYSRHGDWFVWVAVLLAVAGFADALHPRRSLR